MKDFMIQIMKTYARPVVFIDVALETVDLATRTSGYRCDNAPNFNGCILYPDGVAIQWIKDRSLVLYGISCKLDVTHSVK